MAYILGRFEVGDYDQWKQMFDSDPGGRKDAGKGHVIYQNASNPNDVFVGVKFDSADDASAFREKLLASGALDNLTIQTEPTVVEEAEAVEY
jgi:hypothetical protein